MYTQELEISYRTVARVLSPCHHAWDLSLALTPTHGRGLGLWKSGFPIKDGLLPACSAGAKGDMGSIPGLGRSPGGGHGNPLQCSSLENPMDRGAWWAIVHRVTKSQTHLKWLSMHILHGWSSSWPCILFPVFSYFLLRIPSYEHFNSYTVVLYIQTFELQIFKDVSLCASPVCQLLYCTTALFNVLYYNMKYVALSFYVCFLCTYYLCEKY